MLLLVLLQRCHYKQSVDVVVVVAVFAFVAGCYLFETIGINAISPNKLKYTHTHTHRRHYRHQQQ